MEIIENLNKRGFISYLAQDENEAFEIIKQNIPSGSLIGFGGSMTVEQMQLPQKLKSAGYICNHNLTSDKSWNSLCENNRFADYYITSTNAITKDGVLVNIDGRANRISAMCYGPKKLFFVLGTNKICEDTASAILRAENIASPLNAKRLKKETPCTKTGKCSKCNSPDTICKAMLVLYHPTSSMEVHVVIINKEYGF